jgi:hypothetical protein
MDSDDVEESVDVRNDGDAAEEEYQEANPLPSPPVPSRTPSPLPNPPASPPVVLHQLH